LKPLAGVFVYLAYFEIKKQAFFTGRGQEKQKKRDNHMADYPKLMSRFIAENEQKGGRLLHSEHKEAPAGAFL